MLDKWREIIEYISIGVDPSSVPVDTGHVDSVSKMIVPRHGHTSTLLKDGRVLIAGGVGPDGNTLSGAEIYDPATGGFALTGSMTVDRAAHTATLLPDGRVLITGGFTGSFQGWRTLSSAEIYDPSTGNFTRVGSMRMERQFHRATMLLNGTVLITGGLGSNWPNQAQAELFDPEKERFTLTSRMESPRSDHTATLLEDGRVLLTGGSSGEYQSRDVLASAEIYDPTSGLFTPAPSMSMQRHKHSAVLLPGGKVMIIGGANSRISMGQYSSAEIFDPATGLFSPAGNMKTARYKIRDAVVLLKNGRVLVAGASSRLEVYDPATGIFSLVKGEMDTALFYSTATLLDSGEVLITGGYDQVKRSGAGAWIYRPD